MIKFEIGLVSGHMIVLCVLLCLSVFALYFACLVCLCDLWFGWLLVLVQGVQEIKSFLSEEALTLEIYIFF